MSESREAAHRRRQQAIMPQAQSEALFLDIIYRFYPRWERTHESLEQFYQRKHTGPEVEARHAVVGETGRDDRAWLALQASFRAHLPGYVIWNQVAKPHPSYMMTISRERPDRTLPEQEDRSNPPDEEDDPLLQKLLVVCISHLAPYYFLYESHTRFYSEEKPRLFYEPTSEFQPVLAIVDQVISEEWGAQRIRSDLAQVKVRDISPGDRRVGKATIADALFDDQRM